MNSEDCADSTDFSMILLDKIENSCKKILKPCRKNQPT
jgi:hypothetical protein